MRRLVLAGTGVLERREGQIGIAHTPVPLSFGTWGITDSRYNYIRTRMEFDYVRLWQPTNHYSDMDPVHN